LAKTKSKKTKTKKVKEKKPRGPVRTAMGKHAPMVFGYGIPGFIKIHIRYAKHSFRAWFVLFVAPFVISCMSLRLLCEKVLDIRIGDVQVYLVSFFLIALAFYFAERHRKFRRIYVLTIPALVFIYGLINFLADPGRFPPSSQACPPGGCGNMRRTRAIKRSVTGPTRITGPDAISIWTGNTPTPLNISSQPPSVAI